MLGFPGVVTVDSVNEKTRAIAEDPTDSAGFTCPGFHLPRRDETYRFVLYSILPEEMNSTRQHQALSAETEIISGVPVS